MQHTTSMTLYMYMYMYNVHVAKSILTSMLKGEFKFGIITVKKLAVWHLLHPQKAQIKPKP